MNILDTILRALSAGKIRSSSEYYNRHRDLARESGYRFYGDGGTFHRTTSLDVEVDQNGKVCAVWFRCRTLPFQVYTRDTSSYSNPDNIEIHGIEFSILNQGSNPEP